MLKIDSQIFTIHNSLLSNIAKNNRIAAVEASSKAGGYVAKNIRKAMDSKTHHMRKVSHSQSAWDESRTYQLGAMEREQGDRVAPYNLSKFIGWINYDSKPQKFTTVVAEAFQTHNAKMRKNGRVVGTQRVKGTSKETMDLIVKIDTGRSTQGYLAKWGEDDFRRRAYHFKREGYAASRGQIDQALNEGWRKSLGVAMDRFEPKREVHTA